MQDTKSHSALQSVSPTLLVLLSISSIQVGAALATGLFPALGAEGTVAVRILFSALILLLASRRRLPKLHRQLVRHWPTLLLFGLCIAAMNFFFYKSIAIIPLGTAVAFEFIGPLGVAAVTSRRRSHFAWVFLAAVGIVLLSPLSGASLDTLGIFYALLAGAGWACFIILAARVGKQVPGNDGLIIAMTVAAVAMLPFAAPVSAVLVADPALLLACVGIALISTTLPFMFEFAALKRMPKRNYGVLVSVEPAVAALVGAVLLGERIGTQSMIAVACVVIAAIGISISDAQK
ncbi:MAG: DMT family transporter [Halioglobus sp.]